MYQCDYPHLFEPIVLANTYFKNRIFAAPQGNSFSTFGNQPTTENMMFYERKAMGGAAMVCIGDATVDSELAMGNGPHLKMDQFANCVHLNRLSRGISRHGAVASIELNHCGSSARQSFDEGKTIYGAVATKTHNQHHEGDIWAEEMPPEIIERTINKFADAAWLAQLCGFGMVTLHGGHGWLITQFMGLENDRKDEWGGSFENRMRFPLAICEAIRKKCGRNFPIEMRITSTELFDGGYDLDYGVQIAKALDGHLDLIHVSAGCHENDDAFCYTTPSMFFPDAPNLEFCKAIKKEVETPVALVGSLSDPQQLDDIIAAGYADVVQLARQFSADPDMPRKAQANRGKDVNQCIRCYSCFSHVLQGDEYTCAINPQCGWSMEQKYPRLEAEPKRVLVLGGGIAAMQAALTAAKRGHDVTLVEKSDHLGGVLSCERDVPFKKHLHDYLERQARFVEEAGVKVHLNTEATPELCEQIGADAIICAIGAQEFVPPIPGKDGDNVISAQELYIAPDKAGDNVVILGGGLVGTELAIYLGMLGKKTTILEMAPALNCGGNILHARAMNPQIAKYVDQVCTSTKALEITPEGVRAEGPDGEVFFPADTVATAMGLKPRRDEALAMRWCAPEFHLVGDALVSKSIREANWNAYQAGLDVGMLMNF